MKSKGKRGLLRFAAPLAICLPCLLPFILAALLTSVGAGAVGSFLSDNGFWLAILIVLAMPVAFVIGLSISRLRGRGTAIRFLSRDG